MSQAGFLTAALCLVAQRLLGPAEGRALRGRSSLVGSCGPGGMGVGGGGGRGGLRYSPSKEGGEPCSEGLLRAYRAFPYLTFVVPQLLGVIETFVSFLKIMTVCPPTKCTVLNVHLFVYIFREFRASPPWTSFNFPSHPVR